MSCMCLLSLQKALESLGNVPLKALMGAIPEGLVYSPGLTQLSQQTAAHTSVSALARADMCAQIDAALKLGLPEVPADLPKLTALAHVMKGQSSTLSVVTAAKLSTLANTMQANLPAVAPMIAELLGPAMDALMQLMAIADAIGNAQAALGVNLAQPGAAAQLPVSLKLAQGLKLEQCLQAKLRAGTDLGNLALMMNAASSLGVNLASPGGSAQLAAMVNVAAGLPIPPLDLPPELVKLGSAMAAINMVQKATGINLMTPGSLDPLSYALNALAANMEAIELESVDMETIRDAHQLNAIAPANGTNFQALASMDFSGIKLSALPDLSGFSQVAALSQQLGEASNINLMSDSPCGGSCPAAGGSFM